MGRQDLHTHTTFCDGANSPREMVQAALAVGLDCLGFSAHSHTPFDESYCLSVARTPLYRQEIQRLKEEYRDSIPILCGIEQDFYSDQPVTGYDFVIGSVHYIQVGTEYVPIDESPEILRDAARRLFHGDLYALAAVYFDTVARVQAVTDCDIVGHFDLINKFNRDGSLFDETDPRYVAAWTAALDALCPSGALFEVNTGAISRGYQDRPYPSEAMMYAIADRGGYFLLSSDSHRASTLAFGFDQWEERLRALGLGDRLVRFIPKSPHL